MNLSRAVARCQAGDAGTAVNDGWENAALERLLRTSAGRPRSSSIRQGSSGAICWSLSSRRLVVCSDVEGKEQGGFLVAVLGAPAPVAGRSKEIARSAHPMLMRRSPDFGGYEQVTGGGLGQKRRVLGS
jgi:hypothetical protein